MQGYAFAPPSGPAREGQKNYVFVDEQNRHKRLKVMRACNGCRKRKIKCDAATTNTWPCSACVRLKLICVPPAIGQDGDFGTMDPGIEADQLANVPGASDTPHQSFAVNHRFQDGNSSSGGGIETYTDGMSFLPQYITQSQPQSHLGIAHAYTPLQNFSTAQQQTVNVEHGVLIDQDESTAENLSGVLGELRIDETGIAPYIRQQRKNRLEPEAPIQDEAEDLPPLNIGAGSAVRIPPELMPSENEAMGYFRVYFEDIHPYVPVIHRSRLYHQWQNERHAISPLLLEALFACAGRLSDDPAQGAQWLALANRHEPSFMDVPRLSTIQALLLLLKARESAPKKGYYYRSWQTVKTIVSMAKDLDLHEHYNVHTDGGICELDPAECLVQTRVWQALLVVEVMIGAPQGRSDYGVDPNTVDMHPDLNIQGLDQFEISRSRQFAYFIRNAYHIRIITDVYHKIKRQKDWGGDPRFSEKNSLFSGWLHNLPPDLQVTYPHDGSSPWIPSHFVANMHSHCHLGIILLHRPQIVASKSFAAGGGWKAHLSLCYSSAKNLCRLQEAILGKFGLSGLLFMQRGINFAIYCILTCTMLHLIAITSPDPDFNTDAREYFTRHMRILEQCSAAWPMPEIQAQIDSLRLAFSADVNRPFDLKPTFPYGSPSEPYHPSPPPFEPQYPHIGQAQNDIHDHVRSSMALVTPPMSICAEDSKSDPSRMQSIQLMPHNHPSTHPSGASLVDDSNWDPTRIINQWDMAFSVSPSNISASSPPVPIPNTTQVVSNSMAASTQYHIPYESSSRLVSVTPAPPMVQSTFNRQPVMITARDWQRSVASVYDPQGLKRRWNSSLDVGSADTVKQEE
ncbi:hypothetical protein ASPZODRAFT_67523 [Penicilliopsis zonata CBS 506.65]|uniref:Zn(2)-C6 fungal-type domain-containing protein n=1 Tax=Penicilliopsis zonata CBS 506.65 TaxID=1073090 RepID=A0A1L9SGS0_9EURO|nr:hypothetical protein ASPZODRAFT_67523 [Penicilliopsis zonata CBS 506.65]OJJ46323.1 hypothetical protein ASPZODRAFT_67523 [Penicilliopsis zonata CBS 506.65]